MKKFSIIIFLLIQIQLFGQPSILSTDSSEVLYRYCGIITYESVDYNLVISYDCDYKMITLVADDLEDSNGYPTTSMTYIAFDVIEVTSDTYKFRTRTGKVVAEFNYIKQTKFIINSKPYLYVVTGDCWLD